MSPQEPGRRVGLTKSGYRFPGNLLQTVPSKVEKPREPSVDIEAPPKDTSDEASTVYDGEFSDFDSPPPQKKAKYTAIRIPKYNGRRYGSTCSDGGNASSELPTAPSSIPSTAFTHSRNWSANHDKWQTNFKSRSQESKVGAVNEEDDPFGRTSSQWKKPQRTYASNIHKSVKPKEEPKTKKDGTPVVKKGRAGFRVTNEEAFVNVDKLDTSEPQEVFKAPSTYGNSPRRASQRLSKNIPAFLEHDRPQFSKPPKLSTPKKATPEKHAASRNFKKPMALPISPRTTRSSATFEKPTTHEATKVSGTDDMMDLIEIAKDKLKMPEVQYRNPQGSVPASSVISTSFDAASSTSSLSSAPDLQELDDLDEHFAFRPLDTVSNHSPPPAKCPICGHRVERSFLEDFDCGKRLNVRQQVRFCKEHKTRSAESEWQAKKYPKIDWQDFDQRLKKFHPAVDDILKGNRISFYRNAFEDQIKSGQNRTLQQSLMSGKGFEGLAPGYYGSRGARVMTESIMTSFAPRIRRQAATDKLISTAGVAGYVQAVLAPELAVLLVMEDMRVDEDGGRAILRDSAEIGHLLNEEEDEIIRDEEEGKEVQG